MFKKSIIITFIITAILFLIIYKIGNAQTQTTGYTPSLIPPRDRGIGDRVTWYEFIQPGTNTTPGTITSGIFTRYYGTATVTGTTAAANGRIPGTSTLLSQEVYTYSNGSSTLDLRFGQVTINSLPIAMAGSLSGFIYNLNGAGSNTTLENPNLTGVGTLSGTLNLIGSVSANSTTISPTELGYLDGVSGNLSTHAHGGTDTPRISHDNTTGTGTNNHTTIDNHLADTSDPHGSTLTQTTLNATNASIANGTISNNFNMKGYTWTFTSPVVGHQLQIGVDNTITNATTTASVGFGGITGTPTDNVFFSVTPGIDDIPMTDGSGNLNFSGIIGNTSTGALKIATGSSLQRPATSTTGMVRFNNEAGTSTGGTIISTSAYVYHTFTASGNCYVPPQGVEYYNGATWQPTVRTVDVLVIAGGGGGGGGYGGAGGGGGVIYKTNYPASGTITVTIGAGGAGGVGDYGEGSNGSNSLFGSVTAFGGGGGRGAYTGAGKTGGSGGSGAGGGGVYGSGTSGQGYNGGTGSQNPTGGGGGAGDIGSSTTHTNNGGNGGIGINIVNLNMSTLTNTTTAYYAGGGGGCLYSGGIAGNGGIGGGGNGGGVPQAGTANTGGGGGAAGSGQNGGAGGSGIIIVRYIP